MKILHFFTDEKFTEFVIHLFDKFTSINQKYILAKSKSDQIIRFKNSKLIYIEMQDTNRFVCSFAPDLIIFHSLFNDNLTVLQLLNYNAKTCWFSWGGDIALNPLKKFKEVHEEQTFKLYYSHNFVMDFKYKLINIIKKHLPLAYSIYYRLRSNEEWAYYILINNLHKIDIVNTVINSERNIFLQLNYKGDFIHIPVGSMELLIEGVNFLNYELYPTSIFLGHSSYSENNHFDVLFNLKKIDYSGDIICPLSYGDESYAKCLIEYGKKLFGDKFFPILDFMNKKEYFEILQKSNVFINNSIIQQGLGNILVALYFGKKVFLNAKGEVYNYLRELGIETYTIQNDLTEIGSDKLRYNLEEVRKIINSKYSEENVINNIKIFIDKIDNGKQ